MQIFKSKPLKVYESVHFENIGIFNIPKGNGAATLAIKKE